MEDLHCCPYKGSNGKQDCVFGERSPGDLIKMFQANAREHEGTTGDRYYKMPQRVGSDRPSPRICVTTNRPENPKNNICQKLRVLLIATSALSAIKVRVPLIRDMCEKHGN
jgi:hypothetical protein